MNHFDMSTYFPHMYEVSFCHTAALIVLCCFTRIFVDIRRPTLRSKNRPLMLRKITSYCYKMFSGTDHFVNCISLGRTCICRVFLTGMCLKRKFMGPLGRL